MTKVVLFGNERLLSGLPHTDTPVLNGLISSGYDVVAVVAHHENGNSRNNRPLEVAEVATKHHIPVFLPDKPADILPELSKLKADIGVLVAYGRIVPQSVIDIFRHGIINLHPSLLPHYRGATPIETAILNGDDTTGISLMQLVKAMDAGPVFAQESISLTGDENKFEIYEKLAQIGATMLLNNLPKILSGELTATPQNEADATYCQMLTKADGDLNPDTLTATDCDRKIRAYLGFPKTRLNLLGSKVIVTKAKVLDKFNGDDWPDVIKCADNSYLQIKEIVSPNSGKTMPVADYLRGVKA